MAQRNRSLSLKSPKSRQALSLTHPNAAGIDIGSATHFVAVPPDRDDEPVRDSYDALLVSWCELITTSEDGTVRYRNAWASSHRID